MAYPPSLVPFVSFPADAPTLPVRTRRDSGEFDHVVRATLNDATEHGIRLRGTTKCGSSVDISVEIVSPGTARVLLQQDFDPRRVVLARRHAGDERQVSIDSSAHAATLRDADIQVCVQFEPFHITFRDSATGCCPIRTTQSQMSP